MKFFAALLAAALLAPALANAAARPADEYRQLVKVEPLPVALDRNFEFRKTKILGVGDIVPQKNQRVAAVAGGAVRDPAIGFESSYRLFGAVTELDKRRRYGQYYDFFWRAKKPAAVTVRLEYQQEKLRTLTQAREVNYPNAEGSHKTAFAIIGDDFFNDGRVLAWRCLLIANGHVVAEDRSFLWR